MEELMKLIAENDELKKALNESKSMEQFFEALKPYTNMSLEEIKAALMEDLNTGNEKTALSDEKLDAVAGGASLFDYFKKLYAKANIAKQVAASVINNFPTNI